MADSYRLTVLKRLTDHLKQITPTNGYVHDLGPSLSHTNGAVFRGRTLFGDSDPVPMVSILESPRNDLGTFAGTEKEARFDEWSLLIQGWAIDDKHNPTDPAYALMDEVERHLFRINATDPGTGQGKYPEFMLGGSIASITIFPGVARPPMENVSSKAFFYLPIQVRLVRPKG